MIFFVGILVAIITIMLHNLALLVLIRSNNFSTLFAESLKRNLPKNIWTIMVLSIMKYGPLFFGSTTAFAEI
jgi:SulP family sulfate permease